MKTQAQAAQTNPSFNIERLYVKEHTCKIPHGSSIFLEKEWNPDINLEINVRNEKIAQDIYEVIIQINAAAKNKDRTAFTLEVQQAGIFRIQGLSEEQIKLLLEGRCPNILFGYARKVIADLTLNASFPPLVLTPVDFEVILQQRQLQEQDTKNKVTNKNSETA
jgi:preprotein translocase subunit SecB